MMKTRISITFACAAMLTTGAAVFSGCESGQTTAGTRYEMTATRALETHLSGNLDAVHEASVAAVEDLGFTLTSQRKDAFDSHIEAETAGDTGVSIDSHKIGDDTTRVRIKVGLTGDEGRSRAILSAIEDNLD